MRILIGIITSLHPSRQPYIERQQADLADSPLNYKFIFGGGSPAVIMPNSLYICCDDTRPYMVHKNQALFRYALENDYDFCFRMCDDTRVFPERLQEAHLEQYDYAGACLAKIRVGPMQVPMRYLDYMNGGCGIWLSGKAMEMLVSDDWKGPVRKFPPNLDMGFGIKLSIDPWDWDDRWIGEVLKGNLSWDDPKRNNPWMAYALNGINVLEDEMMFFHDDKKRHISIHDLDAPKQSGIKSKEEWDMLYGKKEC